MSKCFEKKITSLKIIIEKKKCVWICMYASIYIYLPTFILAITVPRYILPIEKMAIIKCGAMIWKVWSK